MITLFNPTNETLRMVYAGIDFILESGQKRQADDACANHLLNSHGPRGLCQLVYGDDEKVVAKLGVQRNLEFKKNQVSRYNIMNEQRKMQGLGYLRPTEEIRKYAVELGLSLLEPYALKDEEKDAISTLQRENRELKSQLGELMIQINKFLGGEKPPAIKGKTG